MSAEQAEKTGIQYRNMGIVDLTEVTDASQMVGAVIENVGVVLVSNEHPDVVSQAHCQNVGAVVSVAKGTRVETIMGQGELSAQVLAQYDENTTVMVIGQYAITGPVLPLKLRGLMLIGQLFLPNDVYSALTAKITIQVGQVGQYTGDRVRIWVEDTRIDRAFLELIEEPTALVMFEQATFAADVLPELLNAKVTSIASTEDIYVENPDLEALVRYLAVSHFGQVKVR